MGLFQLVSDWKYRLIDQPLDARMAEMVKVGVAAAKAAAHVQSGRNKESIGGGYNRSTRTAQLHADMPYSAIEELRPGHAYLAVGVNAMARFWGGTNINFEMHYPNAAPMGTGTTLPELNRRETRYRKSHLSRGPARNARIFYRRHHRLPPVPPLLLFPVTSPVL